jgi:hypothetical protein
MLGFIDDEGDGGAGRDLERIERRRQGSPL